MATTPTLLPTPPKETKYIDFLSKYKKQRSYFDVERTASGKPWPYAKQPEEIAYDNWLAETVDPSTGDYYTDNDTGKPAGKYVVESIIRLKLIDGSEVLVSQGHIVALDYFRHRKTFYCDKPEMHLKTFFDHRTRLNQRNQIESICKGPYGKPEEIYEMPFTPENLDKLWSMRRDNNISLVMKTQTDGVAHSLDRKGLIKSNDGLGAYELFKNSDFDYIFNWEYIKEKPTQQQQPIDPNIINKHVEDQIDADYNAIIETAKQTEELNKARPDTNKVNINESNNPKKVK